jgi:heat shock protein HslJ
LISGTRLAVRRASALALGMVVLVAVAACSSSSTATTADLEGTWQLSSVTTADGQQVTVPEGVSPTLQVQGEQVSGNAGCNTFSGGYTLDGDTIAFGPLASTRMACADPVNAVESAYLAALDAVNQVALDGNTLTLSVSGGDPTLIYTKG